MAIKKIIIKSLNSNLRSIGLGGVRFFDGNDKKIDSGSVISNTRLIGDFQNLKVTVGDASNSAYYYIGNVFNTANSQTGTYNTSSYWKTDSNLEQLITVEFKSNIDSIKRIEFNPLPDIYDYIGITSDFYFEFYNEKNEIINSVKVTPITDRNTVQSVDIRWYYNKFLILKNDKYLNVKEGAYSEGLVPTMTSATSASPIVPIQSYNNTNYPSWKIFNGILTDFWSSNSRSNDWVGVDFYEPKMVSKYILTNYTANINQSPKAWRIEGSNDLIQWSIVDSQSNQTGWTQGQVREFEIDNTNKYRYYRMAITDTNGDSVCTIGELQFYGRIPSSLIIIDDAVEQNFINYGMNKSTVIDLESDLTNKVFIEQSPTTLGSGKVFKTTIDTTKTPIKKVSIN